MVLSPLDIANEFISYFTDLFTSSIPRLEFIFHYEGIMTNEFTNSVPSIDECLQILKSMRLNASFGPDGFNVAFYRAAWPWIKHDVHKLIIDFYIKGNLT